MFHTALESREVVLIMMSYVVLCRFVFVLYRVRLLSNLARQQQSSAVEWPTPRGWYHVTSAAAL